MPYIPPPPEIPAVVWELSSNDPHSDRFVQNYLSHLGNAKEILDSWMGPAVNYIPPTVANRVYRLDDLGKPRSANQAKSSTAVEKKVRLIARETSYAYATAPDRSSVAIELIKGTSPVVAAVVTGLFGLFAARSKRDEEHSRDHLFSGGPVVAVLTRQREKVYAPVGHDFGEAATQFILSQGEAGWVWVPRDKFRVFHETLRIEEPFRVFWVRCKDQV
jgi:hypothetical protein